MNNRGHVAEPIFVLNRLIDMPISYAMDGCHGERDAALYFLDYNYIKQERTAACLADLARVGAEQHLAFSDKTLILSAKGLHPANDALLAFVRQFRSHHLFLELWNGIKEVVLLANAQLDHLYLMPVAARLDRPPASRVALRPNNRVFVSLGGDDDTDLIRRTIERCPNLQFFVPDVAWAKPGSEKNFFAVRVAADNVTPVDCAQVQRDRQPTFSPHYQSAYDACDTVLVATVADKMHQMRGGIRLADALRARKHIVTTENPLCQLVMAQHERTCLVASHDPADLAAQLVRVCDGDFQIDEATYEAVRHLTTASNQLPWMFATAAQGEPVQRSVFARGRDLLDVTRASLFAAGRAVLEREVEEVRVSAAPRRRAESEASGGTALRGGHEGVASPRAILLGAVDEFARGKRPQAWREGRRAAAAAPCDGLVQVLASRVLHLLGDHRGALAAARTAEQLGVAAATVQRFEQAREIGWYHEARAILERVLRAGRRHPATAHAQDTRDPDPFDRALGYLLQLYIDAQHYDGAAALLADYLPQARPSVSIYLQAARVFERCGETEPARDVIGRALAVETSTAATRQEAAALLLRLGAFDEAQTLYEGLADEETVGPSALEALARLCLWRGDTDRALLHAERLRARDAGSPAARRIDAAVKVLQGAYTDALPQLDAVLRDAPNDAEAYAWRAEARLRLGHCDEARVDAQRSPPGSGHSFAARALHVLAALPPAVSGGDATASSRPGTTKTPAGLFAHTAQELGAELTAIDSNAPHILKSGDEHAVAALLERALTTMRGNRTPLATWVRNDGTLARLPPSTSARVASRVLLELIKVASPEETLRHFEALVARLPHSSMPLVHRGELHLWLGRYADARADLEAAIAVQRQTRWAWYGLACLDLLGGEPRRALDTCADGIRVMNNTEGPVAFSYRGEAYRLLGRLDEARTELQRACELHPRRLSAWVNLGLVHGAAGDGAAQRDVFRSLASSAPGLLSAAADELGEEVFEGAVLNGPQSGAESCPDGETIDRLFTHVLAMMRGNRSSSCITFFTSDGQLRHVPRGQRIDPQHTVRALSRIRRVLTK